MISNETSKNDKYKVSGVPHKRLIDYLESLFASAYPISIFDENLKTLLCEYEVSEQRGLTVSTIRELDNTKQAFHYHDPQQLWDTLGVFTKTHERYRGYLRSFQQAVELTFEELKHLNYAGLYVKDYNSDQKWLESVSNPKGNPGLVKYLEGFDSKASYLAQTDRVDWMRLREDAIKAGSFNIPIVPAVRHQLIPVFDDNNKVIEIKRKTRLVSMVDVRVILAETQLSTPIQEVLNLWKVYSPGKDSSQLRTNIREARASHRFWYSIDYSKFDQTLPGWLISEAFHMLFNLFKDTERSRWLGLMKLIEHDFIVKKFVVSRNGQLDYVHASNGIPSGSMFTNIIGSLCNVLMVRTYLIAKGYDVEDVALNVCGDDNLIFTNRSIDMVDLADYLTYNFGVNISKDKYHSGSAKDDPQYLSRSWTMTESEDRNPKELIKTACYPERFRSYFNDDDLRPMDVLYALYLTYEAGFKRFIDGQRLVSDYNDLRPGSDARHFYYLRAAGAVGGKTAFEAFLKTT